MIAIREYVNSRGRNHFRRWFDSLGRPAQARIVAALSRVEEGNFTSVKSVGQGLLELRLHFGPGYRIYCGRTGDFLVILLSGGTKRNQQADIDMAHGLWREYKTEMRERK